MVGEFIQKVLSPARLAALRRLGLLDSPAEGAFDRLGALAAKVLKSPVALVTLVDDNRQFFKSCRGLPEPWASWRKTPLSHSFCRHVLATAKPLVVNDARIDPRFADNLAIRDLGVVAYLGIPLEMTTGEVLGSFCVIDHVPRIWTDDEIETLSTLTASVMTEIELRSEIRYKKAALEEVATLNGQLSERTRSLETARKDLEAFTYSISHDLRSPLSTVLTFSHFLREEGSAAMNPECLDYLNRISNGAERIQRILEGLTTLGGMAQAKMRIEEVDLSAIAENILGAVQTSAPERKVTIHIEPGLKAQADRHLMQVGLENLLCNAWKFTSKTAKARIEVGAMMHGGEQVYFVRDNGAGFKEAETSKLFMPFERMHSQQEFAGTGLGLATVKRIIERHQGRIWAESEPGQGATFYFTLEPASPGQK